MATMPAKSNKLLARRLVARVIDFALVWLFFLGVVLIARGVSPVPDEGWGYLVTFTAMWIAYSTIAEAWVQQTVGKRLFGLVVTTTSDAKPTVGAVLLRNVLLVLEIWAWFVALIVVLIRDDQRRLGDLVSGTAVRRSKRRT